MHDHAHTPCKHAPTRHTLTRPLHPIARRNGQAASGYTSIKQHAFFKGLDWNALGAGTLKPPIQPSSKDINADLPRELKNEFADYAKQVG